jgi:Tol biopolymer transport system component
MDGQCRRVGLARLYPGNDTVPVIDARWAPDEAHLAISTYFFENSYTKASHLHIVTADGMQDIQLPQMTDLSPSYNALDWSPTGDRLAVSVAVLDSQNNPGSSSVYIFRPDGTDEREIEVVASKLRWSPQGDRIAYMPANVLYTVRPDGTDITPVRLGTNFTFDWAPDGSRLAVVADDGVRVINADGSNDVLIFPATSDVSPETVAWSPSGNNLAVVTSKLSGGFPQKVTVMNVDGSAAIDVTAESPFQVAVWRP